MGTVLSRCHLCSVDDPQTLEQARACLERGDLVAVPTETVYGLAGLATSSDAVQRLYAAKGRPAYNPLIVHVASLREAEMYGHFSPLARDLAEAFWPGPLTLVVPLIQPTSLAPEALAGLSTVALRVPQLAFTRHLIASLGAPLVAPSANRSGHISPTQADHVMSDLGDSIAMVCDAGPCDVGLESTVVLVDAIGAHILRPGILLEQDLARVCAHVGQGLPPGDPERPLSPGQLSSHYAPKAPVRLEASSVLEGEAFLGFGPLPEPLSLAAAVLNLSEKGDLREAAQNLYAHLRRLDALAPSCIAVAPLPREGLGLALHDRLQRAAADR